MKNIFFIPAAGSANRMNGIPKFLLPLDKSNYLLKFHLENITNLFSTNTKILIGTSNTNYSLLNNLNLKGDLQNLNSNSMVSTVLQLSSQNRDEQNVYTTLMPDTYFDDTEILKKMNHKLISTNLDIVLGLWKISKLQLGKVGQCIIDTERQMITEIIDKDKNCKEPYFWGVVMWKDSFFKFINNEDAHFGISINRAINANLKVGYEVANSRYFDCGTFNEYKELISYL